LQQANVTHLVEWLFKYEHHNYCHVLYNITAKLFSLIGIQVCDMRIYTETV